MRPPRRAKPRPPLRIRLVSSHRRLARVRRGLAPAAAAPHAPVTLRPPPSPRHPRLAAASRPSLDASRHRGGVNASAYLPHTCLGRSGIPPAHTSLGPPPQVPLAKIEDFGAHQNQYYPLEISYFK